jgi:uncharacterized flavoprotein (TIGR03862 family)
MQGALRFATSEGESTVGADATVLALGGGSWSKLGSDGAWIPLLAERGVRLSPLTPANCGFDVPWSEHFRERYAGAPVKSVVAGSGSHSQQGEFIVSTHGVEGGLIYALSAALRDEIAQRGTATLYLDLTPGRELARLTGDLAKPRGTQSMANHIRKQTGLEGVKAGLLRELAPKAAFDDPAHLAQAIKQLPLTLTGPRPLDEAISTAGGVMFEALDGGFMLRALPGVFCAGEMLDWEAPTGGYLLTACFATGHAAGTGAAALLRSRA